MLASEPFHRFKIPIRTEEFNDETEDAGFKCDLVFEYTEKYPDNEPTVLIENMINFEEDCHDRLLEHIKESVCTTGYLILTSH